MNYAWIETDLTPILLAGDEQGLKFLLFESGKQCRESDFPPSEWTNSREHLEPAIEQLTAWFAGQLTEFQLKLAPAGTPFQQRVWQALLEIPYGETESYGEIAQRIGRPTASRAVGLANGRNPISIMIPCHRVIGRSGKLVGYGGGLDKKRWLLDHEQQVLTRNPADIGIDSPRWLPQSTPATISSGR